MIDAPSANGTQAHSGARPAAGALLYWLPEHKDFSGTLQRAKAGTDADRAKAVLELAGHRYDFLQAQKIDRLLAQLAGKKDAFPSALTRVKVAWLAASTVDHLVPATRVAGVRRRLLVESWVAPYGQQEQQLLDPSSELHRFAPDIVFFAGGDPIAELPLTASRTELDAHAAEHASRAAALWKLARKGGATVIHQLTPHTALPVFGALDARVPGAPARVLRAVNAAVEATAETEGVAVLDVDALASEYGRRSWFDPVRWHHAKQLVDPTVAPLFGEHVARLLAAAKGHTAKCLVLDLDNTLWGGVIGDDGLEGIVLGQGSAAGEAYVAFQRYAKRLRDRGILLAVCSKNNHDVAESAFLKHPEMALKRSDIAAFVANWNDKAHNLRAIAEQLNIGLDSLVFFDDNPAERHVVRSELPMVAVPEVPDEPAYYARTLADAGYFETLSFTSDDAQRAGQYQANAEREQLKASSTDMVSYLRSLAMKMTVGPIDGINFARVHQLINKTNQFNVTTRRYTDEQLKALIARPGCVHRWFRLEDRFGDNGLIGVAIAVPLEGAAGTFVVDTFLMSCRVLGRGAEQMMLAEIALAARDQGAKTLVGEYLATPKNGMVADLFPKLGFERESATRFRLTLERFDPAPVFIERVQA